MFQSVYNLFEKDKKMFGGVICNSQAKLFGSEGHEFLE